MVLIVTAIAIAHAFATWRHIPVYWGDYGFNLDIISRAEAGLVPYRDFHWHYPPLSIWVMGALTRVFGIEVTGVWVATLLIYAGIVAAFVWYVRLVVPTGMHAIVAAVALLLAVALAPLGGAPLPLGTYSPPGPIGFLVLLLAWCAALRYLSTDQLVWGLAGSAAAGLAILAKHDYWFAAAFLVGACARHAMESHVRRRLAQPLLLVLPAVFVTLAGLGVVVASTSVQTALDMLFGFGAFGAQANRGAPTLEVITIQIMIVAALAALPLVSIELARSRADRRWTLVASCVGVAAIAAALWMMQAIRIANEVAASGLPEAPTPLQSELMGATSSARRLAFISAQTFLAHTARHPLPVLLPVAAGGVLLAGWPRKTSHSSRRWFLLLLGFAITLRLRRAFEFTEWFLALIEVPVYAAILAAVTPHGWRARLSPARAACLALLVCALVAYYQFGRGALTRRGVHPLTWTPRGWIRSGYDTAGIHRLVDVLNELDSSGKRPVIAFGYSNGFNYFTARAYPRNTAIAYAFPGRSVENTGAMVRGTLQSQPPAIVIDNPFGDEMRFPKAGRYWLSWDRPFERPLWVKQMRAAFQPLVAHCPAFRRMGTGPRAFTVHDCPATAAAPRP